MCETDESHEFPIHSVPYTLHSSLSEARYSSSKNINKTMASRLITHPDAHAKALAYYHKLNVALVAAAPIAVLAHPSPLSTPVDLAIGIALPIHAHVGMMNVISDYAPKISKHAAAPMRA